MNTLSPSIDTSIPTLVETPAPRQVTIAAAAAHDGRLPVVITVIPVADLDARAGVFVDFRMGSKAPTEVPSNADGERGPQTWTERGDEAVAALAASELRAAAHKKAEAAQAEQLGAPGASLSADAAEHAEIKAKQPSARTERPIISRQIGEGLRLTVGQAETFRAEVAVPAVATEDLGWFVRGRFASKEGDDLSSVWQPI